MSKFKKGDIVRITAKKRRPHWDRAGRMDKYIGLLVEVNETRIENMLVPNDGFLVEDKTREDPPLLGIGMNWYFKDDDAELVYRPSTESDTEDAYAKGYKKGADEAWSVARRIVTCAHEGGIDWVELRNIFGDFISLSQLLIKYSAEEAIERVERFDRNVKLKSSVDKETIRTLRKMINHIGVPHLKELIDMICNE